MSEGPAVRREHFEAGFSLIEIVVALALLSLIMGLLAGSVKGTRNVLAFIERNNTDSAILPAQNYVRSALAQATGRSRMTVADQTPGLVGDSRRVHFRTLYSPRGQYEGIYDVEIRLEPAQNNFSDLVVFQTLLRPKPSDGSDAPPTASFRSILASNVASVSLEYFGIDDAEPGQWQWLDAWSSTERLPRLVRLDVTFAPGQTQSWRRLECPLQFAE